MIKMPMVRLIPDTVRYALVGIWTNNRPIVTVLHYHVDDEAPGASRAERVQNQAVRLRDAWQSEMMDVIVNNYTLQSIAWLDLASEAGPTGGLGANGTLPTSGSVAGTDSLPPSANALVIKNITGVRGAKRGRMFLPVLPEGSVDENGNIVSGLLTTLQGKADTFFTAAQNITAPPDGGAKMIVPDYPRIPTPKPQTLVGTFRYVTSLTVQALLASQRRRVRP